jgi:uncharacterized membrane protein YeaQ/YmgE (transglycosylase-associated protein family)
VAAAREPALPHLDIVAGDDERGARLATEHLIGLGHRRIAHITGLGLVGELRRRSFEATMRRQGLAGSMVVEPSDTTEEGGYRATVRLLSGPARPTAIFAFNDIACVGALSAAGELGLEVPRDLSLVGYDNTYLSRIRHLWLNTVDNASYEVGRRAAQCLLDRMEQPGRPGGVQLVNPTLEIRGSTAAPHGDPPSQLHYRPVPEPGLPRFRCQHDGTVRGQGDDMTIIGWIVLGLIAGAIAKILLPGKDPGGLVGTTLIGIAGAVVGGWLSAKVLDRPITKNFYDLPTWGAAIGGALVLLIIYRILFGDSRR